MLFIYNRCLHKRLHLKKKWKIEKKNTYKIHSTLRNLTSIVPPLSVTKPLSKPKVRNTYTTTELICLHTLRWHSCLPIATAFKVLFLTLKIQSSCLSILMSSKPWYVIKGCVLFASNDCQLEYSHCNSSGIILACHFLHMKINFQFIMLNLWLLNEFYGKGLEKKTFCNSFTHLK